MRINTIVNQVNMRLIMMSVCSLGLLMTLSMKSANAAPEVALKASTEEAPKADPTSGPLSSEDLSAQRATYKSLDDFVRGEMRHITGLNLYGSTAQLPQGYLGFKYAWSQIKADQRYNGSGKLGEIFPPLEFELTGQTQLSADLGLTGGGGSHEFLVSYGITDNLNWYITTPLYYMNVSINPSLNSVDDEGNKVGETAAGLLGIQDRKAYNGGDLLYDTFPALGRPTPGARFQGSWLLGDINTGFSWNYQRGTHFASALVTRLYLPTAHIPPSNQNLFFGTGPEIQVGVGSWGLGLSQLHDLRLVKSGDFSLIASSEVGMTYFFEQRRDYPTNFTTPTAFATALDPIAFADLSDLDGEFGYTPGWALAGAISVSASYHAFSLVAGIATQFSQKPILSGDPAFLGMVDSLELVAEVSSQSAKVGALVSLLPLSIPASISLDWQRVVGGRNVIVYQDFYTARINFFLPLFMLWN
jgi:hypothetical protein